MDNTAEEIKYQLAVIKLLEAETALKSVLNLTRNSHEDASECYKLMSKFIEEFSVLTGTQ
jgi:hypothetical protein